jgi:hypothetical protein
VFGLRLEGHVQGSDLGALEDLVSERVELAAGQPFSAAALVSEGVKTVQQRPAPHLLAAAATPRPPFWPTYGSMFTDPFTRTVPRTCLTVGPPFIGIDIPCPVFPITERRVRFFHTAVWVPAALSGFESAQWAYEHDFKIRGTLRIGTKPVCSPIGRNGFYATRRGVMWESGFPRRTAPYFDTDATDACSLEDLTVGLALPEKLNDGRPAGANVTGWISIDARRGSPPTGPFRLAPQSLKRDTSVDCDVGTVLDYFRKWCIGRDGDETIDAAVVDSNTSPSILLPRCFNWRWLPVGSPDDGPTTFRTRACFAE